MTLRPFFTALALLAFLAGPAAAQTVQPLVISEVDTRTPNADEGEFVEIYNPNSSTVDLSNYALVLYDGSTDGVYRAINLGDRDLGAGEYFVLCSDTDAVDNCDRDIGANGFLENGPDAVALYFGGEADFPDDQEPGDENDGIVLVDALVYGPASNTDNTLINKINASSSRVNLTEQYDENENGEESTESLQRTPSPTSAGFTARTPTPGESPTSAPSPLPDTIDIDEARDRGPGATVTVQGVVTRAEGDVLFLEDDTAALKISLESRSDEADDLRDDIADGTVGPGTVLTVQGTLDEEGQIGRVLVIPGNRLGEYSVDGTDFVPDPQVVTLRQISLNGEDYESELVQIVDVRFGQTGTFVAGNTYALDDDTVTQNGVNLFVPSADDTRLEGTPIPAGQTVVTGIVGQASFAFEQYQVLGIDPDDIGGNATEGGGPGPEPGPGNTGDPDVDLVISEIDPSQAGPDTAEFVEIFNAEPLAVDLDGYVLVLFSGNGDDSYLAVDLDGETIAPGGLFVVCGDGSSVDECDLEIDGQTQFLVNGPAAVALYAGSDVDFPAGTDVTRTNLVDAVVYSSQVAAPDNGLLLGLGVGTQLNEDVDGTYNETSLQRVPVTGADFEAAAPTPGELPAEGPMEVTIAEARELGEGEEVTVTGTVSRAMGAFVYLQDGTAGLAIRQTEGAFFNAVAGGRIVPGTVVTVTGELSEFRGLLQINGDDLTDFETQGTGNAPDPVLVTLRQIAQNGEAYEGELVAVTGVAFEAEGGMTFEAGTNYAVSDGTSMAVPVRVPNAPDTMVDGERVPDGPVTVIGIVGQFDNVDDGIDEGYQLLVIDVADVNPQAVANERTPNGELAITVANPIRSATTVGFEVTAAGPARLALYDALGRRVAVLADGPVAAGVHEARLATSSLAPGVYVLRLEAEEGAATRTVTVVR